MTRKERQLNKFKRLRKRTLLLRNPVDPEILDKRNNLKALTKRYADLLKEIAAQRLINQDIKKKYDTLIATKSGMVKASEYTKLFKYSEMLERELAAAKEELRYLKLFKSVEQIKAVLRGAGLWHR